MPSRHMKAVRRFPAWLCLTSLAIPLQAAAASPSPWIRVEDALHDGDVHRADSLFTLAQRTAAHEGAHLRRILAARLAAVRGDWKSAEATLRAWEGSPERREGSGEILFWSGWAALHQGRDAEAESLLVLAGAYTAESRSQDALEYRLAARLDPSPALRDYLRGLPESPLPHSLRAESLKRVPPASALYPHARWHLGLLLEARGDSVGARAVWTEIADKARTPPARRAALLLARNREDSVTDSSVAAYEALILGQQQGVAAEIARKMAKKLREIPDK